MRICISLYYLNTRQNRFEDKTRHFCFEANLDKTPQGTPNYRSEKDEGRKCEESAWNTYGPQMANEGIVYYYQGGIAVGSSSS